jgi:apolipoprotein D and lipocalin family protein
MIRFRRLAAVLIAPALALMGCQGTPRAPLATVAHVDLPRFMGEWYVIANIPTRMERGAHNAVERYALAEDGSIDTTFTFREDGFEGKLKTMRPRGFVLDRQSNARWGMRFIWPVKADYRIIWLDADYTRTVVGRQKRDYVWIMARTPVIPDAQYQELLRFVAEQGYDISRVQRVPQRWPDPVPGAAR